jgi:aspartate 1-decarboxylase
MATVYSTQKTKWSQNVPSEKVNYNEQGGNIKIAYADYEASSLASGDVIQMFNLPNGARIIDGYLANDALGGSTTLSVGYAAHTNSSGATVSASAAAYLAATSTASAARTDIAATIALGSGSVTDADGTGVPVTVTMGGATGTGTIQLVIRYVKD